MNFFNHVFKLSVIITALGAPNKLYGTQMLMAPTNNNLAEQVAQAAVEATGGISQSFLKRCFGFVSSCVSTAVKRTITHWKNCPLWIKGVTTIGLSFFSIVGASFFAGLILFSSIVCWCMDVYNNLYGVISSVSNALIELAEAPVKFISNTFEALGVPKGASKTTATAIFIIAVIFVGCAAFSWIKAKSQERKEVNSAKERLKGVWLEKFGKRKPLSKKKKTAEAGILSAIFVLVSLCTIGWFIGSGKEENQNIQLPPVDQNFRFTITENNESIKQEVKLQEVKTTKYSPKSKPTDTNNNDDSMSLDDIVAESVQGNEKQRGDDELTYNVVNRIHGLDTSNPLLVSTVNTIKDNITGSNKMPKTINSKIKPKGSSITVSTVNSNQKNISNKTNKTVKISSINSSRRSISSNMNNSVSISGSNNYKFNPFNKKKKK